MKLVVKLACCVERAVLIQNSWQQNRANEPSSSETQKGLKASFCFSHLASQFLLHTRLYAVNEQIVPLAQFFLRALLISKTVLCNHAE